MTSAQDFIAQADALLGSDLSEEHVDVQSLARTYEKRKADRQAHVFARALVKRARMEGVAIPSARSSMTKADLESEVDRRGLTVEGTGSNGNVTKADLEAALKADDGA